MTRASAGLGSARVAALKCVVAVKCLSCANARKELAKLEGAGVASEVVGHVKDEGSPESVELSFPGRIAKEGCLGTCALE